MGMLGTLADGIQRKTKFLLAHVGSEDQGSSGRSLGTLRITQVQMTTKEL